MRKSSASGFRPTPLDIALAQHPSAEAEGREVMAAARPDWRRLDIVAARFAAAMDDARQQISPTTHPAAEQQRARSI